MRVLPHNLGFEKELHYFLPKDLAAPSTLARGSLVRVNVRGRSTKAWVTDLEDAAPEGMKLQPVRKFLGIGPSEEVLDLCDWAASRWLGRRARFYQLASPPRQVHRLPKPLAPQSPKAGNSSQAEIATEALQGVGVKVLRMSPDAKIWPVAEAAMKEGESLVLLPDEARAKLLADHARKRGLSCALWPEQWERAAGGGCSVVGTRRAVFATMPEVRSILMLDEHAEGYQEIWQSATWHAREVALERSKRQDVPLLMVSPAPTLAALEAAETVFDSSQAIRWPQLHIVDLREREHVGLFSYQLSERLQTARKAVCILNRKDTKGAVAELARLLGEPVGRISAKEVSDPNARVLIATSAAFTKVGKCDLLAFLEFDQMLTSPHHRAEEMSLATLAEGARLVAQEGGELLVQTRHPEHPVLRAAKESDTAIFTEHDRKQRMSLRLPPFVSVAKVTGEEAEEFLEGLQALEAVATQVSIAGPDPDGAFLVRAPKAQTLLEFFGEAYPRNTPDSVRISVDPPRI